MLGGLQAKWSRALREALESALAAGIAWWIGLLVFGPEHTPLFAAIAAIVSLAPGLPSHSRQALGLVAGVVVGIVVGEIALASFEGAHPALLALVVFISIMLAISVQVQPIIGIQAGVSTVIVLVEGQGENSYARIIDALIGGTVALAFSQVLLTPDPFAIMRRQGGKLLDAAKALREALDKCRKGEVEASEVRSAVRDLDMAAADLDEQLEYVERIGSRTLRGRMHKKRIGQRVSQWRECTERLRLALGDVAHSQLASEGEASNSVKLEEARRWMEAGSALASGSDSQFLSVQEKEREGAQR